MEGPFGTFIDGLANAVSSAGTMKTIMYSLGAMSLGRMIAQLGTMVALNSASAAAAMTTAGALTLGIGLIAIVAAVGSAMSSMESQAQSSAMNMRNVNDGMIGPGGNSVLSTSKGSFQFAAEDTIIATSNKPGNNSSKTEEKFDKLIALFEKGNKNTEAIAKKDTNLTVNAIPGVAYEQQQLNNQQVFNTSVS